jgi:hypothetical protein
MSSLSNDESEACESKMQSLATVFDMKETNIIVVIENLTSSAQDRPKLFRLPQCTYSEQIGAHPKRPDAKSKSMSQA